MAISNSNVRNESEYDAALAVQEANGFYPERDNTLNFAGVIRFNNILKILGTTDQKTTEEFANEGAAANRITITDSADILGPSAYAEISNGSAGPQQTGIGLTAVKIDQFDSVGVNKNITVSGPNSNLTITAAGFYSIFYSLSYTGTNDTTYVVAVNQNDLEVTKSITARKLDVGVDVGSVASRCILQLAVGDVIDIRVRALDAGNNFTVQAGNFIIEKVR